MKELKVEDFKIREHQISLNSDKTILLINTRVEIGENDNVLLHLDFSSENKPEESIGQNIKLINERLYWIKENIDNIKDIIVNAGYVSLAEKWVKDLADSEDGYYIVDEQKVSLPIEKEYFKNSLSICEVALHFREDEGIPIIEICVGCDPDYFSGHIITLYVDRDKNIKLAGLEG